MSVILKGAVKLYYYLNEEIADPRTQNWYLMRTPWPGLALMILYLLTVFKWLPKYMSSRPAYDLRPVIAVYNIIQIIGCSYVVYQSLALGWLNHYSFICQPADDGPHSVEYAWRVCYMYFVIKFADLGARQCPRQVEREANTAVPSLLEPFRRIFRPLFENLWIRPERRNFCHLIFFVLRKKQNQVTFLHVYHHFGMVAVSWGIVKWVPGGHITFLISANCFVHIIMYIYYLLTTWDESYKKSLWWKKHVTQIQIIQFTIILIHFLLLVATKDCRFPREPAYIMIPQNLFMVILFCDFYYKAYIRKPKSV